MADLRQMAASLAETYWGRPASEAELVAMAGEMERDSAHIALRGETADNRLFAIEPATYFTLMMREQP